MSKVHVFVSFDLEHDEDLYERLVAQSRTPSSGFAVSGGSKRSTTHLATESVRRQIREADQVIVICGEHTEASACVGAELLVAQEEQTPYFLLWGRRDSMCTKPHGAKTAEGMYSWTRQILQEQITFTSRKAAADAAAASLCNAHAKR
ncbi:MAG TPA: TIR domain-containing protein [Vicinamibacteria bacterium]